MICATLSPLSRVKKWWEDEDGRGTDNDEITDVPDGFKTWAADNQERIAQAEQRGTIDSIYLLLGSRWSDILHDRVELSCLFRVTTD